MLETLVASILNRTLGSYVENFDPKQLNIGLLSGDVKLRDLRLKRAALDQLHLPINVVDGRIGSLSLQIPYSNLKTKPVKIDVVDVFLLAVPDLSSSSTEDEKRREHALKLDKLETWELSDRSPTQEELQDSQNFKGSLVTKIIDNLQVRICNIHIRYEDNECRPQSPFAMGFTLGELSAESANEKWQPTYIAEITPVTHKLATLDALAFYWDTNARLMHQDPSRLHLEAFKRKITDIVGEGDILRPVNAQGFITLNKRPENEGTPRIKARLDFEEFSLSLDRDQYHDLLAMVDQYQKYFSTRDLRRHSPQVPPSQDPLGWFRYAANTVLTTIHERNQKWTWAYISRRIADMSAYIALYKQNMISAESLSPEDSQKFDDIEKRYSYEDLILFRSIAKNQLKADAAQGKQFTQKKTSSSWSSWLWGSKDSSKPSSQHIEISEEQKRELYEVLDLDENGKPLDYSANQVLLELSFALGSGSATLRQGKKRSLSPIGSMSFSGFSSDYVKRLNSFSFSFTLAQFNITDMTQKSEFSHILRLHHASDKKLDDSPFFWMMFSYHPLEQDPNPSLFLKSRSVAIIHSAPFLEQVIGFFQAPADRGETVDAILNAANKTVEELREQTRMGLEYALQEHKTMNLQIDIEAPIIFVPLNTHQRDSPVTVFDVGSLSLLTELVESKILEEVKSKQAAKYTEKDWEQLNSLMYDRYIIRMQDTQILLGNSFTEAKANLSRPSSKLHFLDKTNLNFVLELCIVPQIKSLTRSRLSIRLPRLHATMADVQYKLFMQTIDTAMLNWDSAGSDSLIDEKDEEKESTSSELSASISKVIPPAPATEQVKDNLPAQHFFELSFIVDSFELTFVRGWDADPLVKLILNRGKLDYYQTDDVKAVDISVHDLSLEDHLNTSAPAQLKNLAKSQCRSVENQGPGIDRDQDSDKNLLTLVYRRYLKEEVVEQKADMSLATINFTLTPTTVLAVYDYVLSTFGNQSATEIQSNSDSELSTYSGDANPGCNTVRINFDKVALLLNEDNVAMARMELENTEMLIEFLPELKFDVNLGAVSVTDEMNAGSPQCSALRQLLNIEGGGNLASFHYEAYQCDPRNGVYALIYFRSGPLRLNVVEEPWTRISRFFARFTDMKTVYDQARMIAFDQAIQFVSLDRMKFDIIVSAPIVVYPRLTDTQENMVARLGEFYFQNVFEPVKNRKTSFVNQLKAEIRNIHLHAEKQDSHSEKLAKQSIIDHANLNLNISYLVNPVTTDRPLLVAKSEVSPVTVDLTEHQYQYILQFIAAGQRILQFASGLEESEVGDLKKKLQSEKRLNPEQAAFWSRVNQIQNASNNEKLTCDKLDFKLVAPEFALNLFTSEPGDMVTKMPVSSFKLSETQAFCAINKEGFLSGDLTVRSFTVSDTRKSSKNKFSHIIPAASHGGHQFICRVTRHRDSHPVYNVSIDSPQCLLAFDFLFALKSFISEGQFRGESNIRKSSDNMLLSDQDIYASRETSNFADPSPSSPSQDSMVEVISAAIADDNSTNSSNSLRGSEDEADSVKIYDKVPYVLNVNVVDLYLTIMADASNENSEALVIKIEQVLLAMGITTTVTLSKIGVFLALMKSFDDSRLRILDDFNITMAVDNHETTPTRQMTSVKIAVEPVILRLSPREIMLISTIANRAMALCSDADNSTVEAATKLCAPKFSKYSEDGRRTRQIRAASVISDRPDIDDAEIESGCSSNRILVMGENLQADFEGMRLVLIDPMQQLPMGDIKVDPFCLNAKNWTNDLRVDALAQMNVNVYSFAKSAWEPLIENLEFGFNISQQTDNPNSRVSNLFSRSIMDVEITPEVISLAHNLQEYFTVNTGTLENVFSAERREDGYPYRIHNKTGYDIEVWSDCHDSRSFQGTLTIPTGHSIKWSFFSWRVFREDMDSQNQSQSVSLGVNLKNSGFVPLRSIGVNRTGEHLFLLEGKEGQTHRIVFDVFLESHLKHIVIRSTAVLSNEMNVPLDIRLESDDESIQEWTKKNYSLAVSEEFALPIAAVDSRIYIKPATSAMYDWSDTPLYWRNLMSSNLTLRCQKRDSDEQYYIHVTAESSKDIPLSKHYPFMKMNFASPFEIINNLPCDFEYRLYCKDIKKNWTGVLKRGERCQIHVVNRDQLLLFCVQPLESGFGRSEFAIINSHNTKLLAREELLVLHHEDGQKLRLQIQYIDLPGGKGFGVVVFAPYVLLNHTGHNLTVSSRTNKAHCSLSTGDFDHDSTEHCRPKMWSFENPDSNNRALLKINDSHWSPPVSFNAVGSKTEVIVPSSDWEKEIHLGVMLMRGEGRYHTTRVVTITPRFIICNRLDRALKVKEPRAQEPMGIVEPGSNMPVSFIFRISEGEMCLSFDRPEATFSNPFIMSHMGTTYVRLQESGKPSTLLKLDIILEGATLFVNITNAGNNWPYSIRNFTDLEYHFYQCNPNVDEDGMERPGFTPLRYLLPPRSAMAYSWDYPAANLKEIVLESGDFSRRVQLAEIGNLPPAKLLAPDGSHEFINLNVVADGPQQALVISKNDQEESQYQYIDSRDDVSARDASVELLGEDTTHNTVKSVTDKFDITEIDDEDSARKFRINIKGIGISYINRDNKELCYATFRNIYLGYRTSDFSETLTWQCQWIQIDNCLPGVSDFPVILYPSVLLKTADEMKNHPTFSGSISRVKDESYGLTYIKHATMLLQEMTIEMNEDFLLEMIKMVKKPDNVHMMYNDDDSYQLCDVDLRVPEPAEESNQSDIYIEQLHLQPMQLNLSFMRTGAITESGLFGASNTGISYLIDALSMAIGNINDAPVRFNALLIENVRTQPDHLQQTIQTHYGQEFLYQLHKIIGSADVIGNPVGLFNNISSGVMDLFYEPYLGYTIHERPQELGIGLAKGGLSLMKKSVFGFADSISKVTGSLSKGLAVITMDPQYQRRQRNKQARNRPRHALYGLSMGAASFYDSVCSGVEGLALAPIRGATTDGTVGFLRGLGVGLIGLPTKTAIGLLDFTSYLTEGVRNTTTVFDTNSISRIRLPRVVAPDGLIRPYNIRESVGQMILHNVQNCLFASDHYLAHSNLTSDKVVIVSQERLLMATMGTFSLEWQVPYDEIGSIIMERSGIEIKLHNDVQGPFIPITSGDTRNYIYRNIGQAVAEYNRIKNTLF